ncbi:hypothetical protein TNCT6_69250 [Streptomyces sp. 6-11-2]|nr:hypothetical protein TNCT6_69250 [Streptomyces sp. 6-11-2]
MEETFQSGKGLAGLDESQVRRYPSWTRWVTLVMFVLARSTPGSRAPPTPPSTIAKAARKSPGP